MQFTPLEDFFSDELQSQYCAGQNYTVRPGNDRLAELVAAWAAVSRVSIVAGGSGKVSAKGKVT